MKHHVQSILKQSAIALAIFAIASTASAQVSDQQIKDFFATNPTPEQIAAAAASLGMNSSQISAAMGVANYGGNQAERDGAIQGWVGNQNNGYTWGNNGSLVQNGQTATGRAAAAAAIRQGTSAYGQGASWARGSQSVCPPGMTVSLNRAGIPKCIGAMTREFPTGEAQINTAATAAAAAASNGQATFANNAVAQARSNTTAQDYNPNFYGNLATSGALSENNYGTVYESIVNRASNNGVVVGVLIGDTKVYTRDDMRSFFESKPSAEQIAAKAAEYRFTPEQVAETLSMMNGAPYDPNAVKAWIAQSSGYAISPMGQVMAIQPGMTKTSNGQLTIPERYNGDTTQYARDWMATGQAYVNGGNVIYTAPNNSTYNAATATFVPNTPAPTSANAPAAANSASFTVPRPEPVPTSLSVPRPEPVPTSLLVPRPEPVPTSLLVPRPEPVPVRAPAIEPIRNNCNPASGMLGCGAPDAIPMPAPMPKPEPIKNNNCTPVPGTLGCAAPDVKPLPKPMPAVIDPMENCRPIPGTLGCALPNPVPRDPAGQPLEPNWARSTPGTPTSTGR